MLKWIFWGVPSVLTSNYMRFQGRQLNAKRNLNIDENSKKLISINSTALRECQPPEGAKSTHKYHPNIFLSYLLFFKKWFGFCPKYRQITFSAITGF